MRAIHLLVPALTAICVLPAAAQTTGRHVFDIEPPSSSFSFSGSISYSGLSGPIQGNPSTFTVSGQTSADLGLASSGIVQGTIVAGNSTVVTIPTLNAIVPNPLPFLPPLATIQVVGARAVFRSVDVNTGAPATFAVGGGAFSTGIEMELLSGVAAISGAVNQQIPLTGVTSTPQAVSGALTVTPNGVRLNVSIQTTINFSDPGTGATGSLVLNGTLVGDDQMFAAAETVIHSSVGGAQVMRLSAGSQWANRNYAVLATGSGTSPGLSVGGVTIPLNFDGFTELSLTNFNSVPYTASAATLDARGFGTARFTLPALPAALNAQLHHAYVVLTGPTPLAASNAIPLTIAP